VDPLALTVAVVMGLPGWIVAVLTLREPP